MGYTPVWGVAGGPVLNFEGTHVVAMESPNPHADWSFVNVSDYPRYATQTISAGEMLLHPDRSGGTFTFSGLIDFFLTYDGNANINCALSWSNSSHLGYVGAACTREINGATVGGIGGIMALKKGGLTSGSFAVPYYRYRLRLSLAADGMAGMTPADWIKLTVTLS